MNISPPPLPHGRQNTPSSPPINTTDTLQITVSYKTRTIALRVNDGPIIADLLPDIARRLGILDPSIVYGGYRLLTSDGDPLSPAKTLREQHVPNHSTLTLEPGASSDTDIIYDDVVEAVGASVQHVYRPWTSDHTTFTSLVIGLGLLVISAGWIALFPASIWASVLAFGFSAILLALTAALCGKNLLVQSTAIGLIASIFTAIGGYQLRQTATACPATSWSEPGTRRRRHTHESRRIQNTPIQLYSHFDRCHLRHTKRPQHTYAAADGAYLDPHISRNRTHRERPALDVSVFCKNQRGQSA